jgi:hypothetical protein
MRAAHRRTMDKITRDIVREIEATWLKTRAKAGDARTEEWDKIATGVVVNASIKYLRATAKLGAPIWGYRRENVEAIKGLQALIKRFLKAYKKLPLAALMLLFMPEESGTADKMPSEASQQKSLIRARKITTTLNYIDWRCAQIIAARPGKHGAAEHLKHYCADEAWRLLRLHFAVPASGARTSVLGKLASLLHEAVTGKYGIDLERECRDALKRGIAGDLSIDGETIGSGQLPR